jgi:hypothetical protein
MPLIRAVVVLKQTRLAPREDVHYKALRVVVEAGDILRQQHLRISGCFRHPLSLQEGLAARGRSELLILPREE